jgi:hypothetical protein
VSRRPELPFDCQRHQIEEYCHQSEIAAAPKNVASSTLRTPSRQPTAVLLWAAPRGSTACARAQVVLHSGHA